MEGWKHPPINMLADYDGTPQYHTKIADDPILGTPKPPPMIGPTKEQMLAKWQDFRSPFISVKHMAKQEGNQEEKKRDDRGERKRDKAEKERDQAGSSSAKKRKLEDDDLEDFSEEKYDQFRQLDHGTLQKYLTMQGTKLTKKTRDRLDVIAIETLARELGEKAKSKGTHSAKKKKSESSSEEQEESEDEERSVKSKKKSGLKGTTKRRSRSSDDESESESEEKAAKSSKHRHHSPMHKSSRLVEHEKRRIPPADKFSKYLNARLSRVITHNVATDEYSCRGDGCNPNWTMTRQLAELHNATHHSPAADDSPAALKKDHQQLAYVADVVCKKQFTEFVCACCKPQHKLFESERHLIDHLKDVHPHSLERARLADPEAFLETPPEYLYPFRTEIVRGRTLYELPDDYVVRVAKGVYDLVGDHPDQRYLCTHHTCNDEADFTREEIYVHYQNHHTSKRQAIIDENIDIISSVMAEYNGARLTGQHEFECRFGVCASTRQPLLYESYFELEQHFARQHPVRMIPILDSVGPRKVKQRKPEKHQKAPRMQLSRPKRSRDAEHDDEEDAESESETKQRGRPIVFDESLIELDPHNRVNPFTVKCCMKNLCSKSNAIRHMSLNCDLGRQMLTERGAVLPPRQGSKLAKRKKMLAARKAARLAAKEKEKEKKKAQRCTPIGREAAENGSEEAENGVVQHRAKKPNKKTNKTKKGKRPKFNRKLYDAMKAKVLDEGDGASGVSDEFQQNKEEPSVGDDGSSHEEESGDEVPKEPQEEDTQSRAPEERGATSRATKDRTSRASSRASEDRSIPTRATGSAKDDSKPEDAEEGDDKKASTKRKRKALPCSPRLLLDMASGDEGVEGNGERKPTTAEGGHRDGESDESTNGAAKTEDAEDSDGESKNVPYVPLLREGQSFSDIHTPPEFAKIKEEPDDNEKDYGMAKLRAKAEHDAASDDDDDDIDVVETSDEDASALSSPAKTKNAEHRTTKESGTKTVAGAASTAARSAGSSSTLSIIAPADDPHAPLAALLQLSVDQNEKEEEAYRKQQQEKLRKQQQEKLRKQQAAQDHHSPTSGSDSAISPKEGEAQKVDPPTSEEKEVETVKPGGTESLDMPFDDEWIGGTQPTGEDPTPERLRCRFCGGRHLPSKHYGRMMLATKAYAEKESASKSIASADKEKNIASEDKATVEGGQKTIASEVKSKVEGQKDITSGDTNAAKKLDDASARKAYERAQRKDDDMSGLALAADAGSSAMPDVAFRKQQAARNEDNDFADDDEEDDEDEEGDESEGESETSEDARKRADEAEDRADAAEKEINDIHEFMQKKQPLAESAVQVMEVDLDKAIELSGGNLEMKVVLGRVRVAVSNMRDLNAKTFGPFCD